MFVERLGTLRPTAEQAMALGSWLDALHAVPATPPTDPLAVDRGRTIFEDPSVGCTTCHSGSHFTDNATVDVGTGGAFQVPSLVNVSLHPPYLHNGCAATLRDRFGACGGGDRHGHTSQLADAQLNDLVSYLETL